MLAAFFSDFIQQPVIPRKERKEKLTMIRNDCDEWKAWPEIANDKYREREKELRVDVFRLLRWRILEKQEHKPCQPCYSLALFLFITLCISPTKENEGASCMTWVKVKLRFCLSICLQTANLIAYI